MANVMCNNPDLESIMSQIERLSKADQRDLMKKLAILINDGQDKSPKLIDLNGLGTNVWSDINIDGYVKEERLW